MGKVMEQACKQFGLRTTSGVFLSEMLEISIINIYPNEFFYSSYRMKSQYMKNMKNHEN